jgi:hypothetical protein
MACKRGPCPAQTPNPEVWGVWSANRAKIPFTPVGNKADRTRLV